jgi:hypothetical protein
VKEPTEEKKEKKKKEKKEKKDSDSGKVKEAKANITNVKPAGKSGPFKKNFYKESSSLASKSASDISSWRGSHVCS